MNGNPFKEVAPAQPFPQDIHGYEFPHTVRRVAGVRESAAVEDRHRRWTHDENEVVCDAVEFFRDENIANPDYHPSAEEVLAKIDQYFDGFDRNLAAVRGRIGAAFRFDKSRAQSKRALRNQQRTIQREQAEQVAQADQLAQQRQAAEQAVEEAQQQRQDDQQDRLALAMKQVQLVVVQSKSAGLSCAARFELAEEASRDARDGAEQVREQMRATGNNQELSMEELREHLFLHENELAWWQERSDDAAKLRDAAQRMMRERARIAAFFNSMTTAAGESLMNCIPPEAPSELFPMDVTSGTEEKE
ncbi:hypothetical protein B484DRAFT_191145 [Ochromonadaceae sp. CCMP2298]|nr:hypothetical protein B484DRAFT_191145 [Ochromonadaceae sp. CCMP2298]